MANATTYVPISNSTFLDFAGAGVADPTQTVVQAYGITDAVTFDGVNTYGINVALVLPRLNNPETMLAGDWASRQATLQSLNATDSLWTTYGAQIGQFNAAVTYLTQTLGLTVLASTGEYNLTANSNYISSPESRTIWVSINTQAEFQALFGSSNTLMYSPSGGYQGYPLYFWESSLSLPSQITIAGLWFDQNTIPQGANMAPGVTAPLQTGPQSTGSTGDGPAIDPQLMASLYNYPLDGANYTTGAIGLIEPAAGTYLSQDDPEGRQFQERLTKYLTDVKTSGTGITYVQGINGQNDAASERSLDVGIVAAINPNSNLALYNGSGDNDVNGNARSSTFTAIQSAIWGTANNAPNTNPPPGNQTVTTPPVTTNSWGDYQVMSPDSPFYQAYAQLYVDAALLNQTTLIALGDGGSGNQIANGLPNVEINITSPYNILVSGSSLSRIGEAALDPTLNDGPNSLYQLALAGDPQTIWTLASGGLSTMPNAANVDDWLVEMVWNDYDVVYDSVTDTYQFSGGNGGSSYTQNHTGAGGVDTTQSTPAYQVDYGLASAVYSNLALTGRGLPDVAAPAGGNLYYVTPDAEMQRGGEGSGTSAATPFWASLITQINYVFGDQGLPNLGYMTDLLYIASVIAPGSFNDISTGNNISSYSMGDGANYGGINPTGYGYEAGAGYDLTSGLGSPNGLLLARALVQIAQSQTYYDDTVPDVITSASGGWISGTAQTLLFQTTATETASVFIQTGSETTSFDSAANAAFAWTSQFAQQTLQSDYDPSIVTLFDGQAQGTVMQTAVAASASLSIDVNGSGTAAAQANLSASFGFADFYAAPDNFVRVAQSVAVAETSNEANDVNAVVRVRQAGMSDVSLTFYRVDDYNGTIGGVAPGESTYAGLVNGRAYTLLNARDTTLEGPGYGNFVQDQLTQVYAGQLIATQFTNTTTGDVFWAFSQANESVNGEFVTHLWNYGANTWGWEDSSGVSDYDFNDIVVQFDFTSTAGHQLLVT